MNLFFAITFLSHIVLSYSYSQTFYEILGLTKHASIKDINKAYRKLAVQYHPDKNKEEGAIDKFREITNAYETLKDPKKRKKYDQLGHDMYMKSEGKGHGQSRPDSWGSFDEFFKMFDEDMFGGFSDDDDDDFFGSSFFGGDHFGGQFEGSHRSSGGRKCSTVTTRRGNVVTTRTICN